jgi:branched-chain amino acid transport system permease protein
MTARHGVWALIAVAAMLVPLLIANDFLLGVFDIIAINALVAVGLCILMGFAGQLSIAHGAFFALGAYGSAILSVRGLPVIAAIVLAQILTALVALAIGAAVLRLRGHYLAVATLAFAVIVETVIKEAPDLTGGLAGLGGIAPLSLGGIGLGSDRAFYYVAWSVLLLGILFAVNLAESRFGLVLRAIREGEDVARQFGVSAHSYKIRAFVIASLYASLAGSLYAHYVLFLGPDTGSLGYAIDIILALAVGGFSVIWGALLGVASVTFLNEYFADFAQWKPIAFGSVLIVIMMTAPQGLLPALMHMTARLRRGVALRP